MARDSIQFIRIMTRFMTLALLVPLGILTLTGIRPSLNTLQRY